MAGINCKKSSPVAGPLLTGKLIVAGPCANFAIQLVQGDMDTS
jgi:hypothetical protein